MFPYVTGKSGVGARCRMILELRLSRVPHVVEFTMPTMTLKSTSDSPPIFKNGKLKPGIYEIQNLSSETYLDIHQHSREVCCRPAKDIEGGRRLVRLYLPSAARVSND